jgi:hypothetical protein
MGKTKQSKPDACKPPRRIPEKAKAMPLDQATKYKFATT